ncbi:MAG: hypothetical protein FJ315_06525 [SAR202 cluster bacterium]|nr:hypothetical protein [SAR202 cluster bacterium]
MTAEQVLEVMRAYFEEAGTPPGVNLANFGALSPRLLLTESLDVVTFLVYLEEELEREFPLQEMGEASLNQTFAEMAAQIAGLSGSK